MGGAAPVETSDPTPGRSWAVWRLWSSVLNPGQSEGKGHWYLSTDRREVLLPLAVAGLSVSHYLAASYDGQ
jgi:hypothetical protein